MALPWAEAAKGTQSLLSQFVARVIQETSPISEYITVRDTMGHRTLTHYRDADVGENTWVGVNEDPPAATNGAIDELIVSVSRTARFMKIDRRLADNPRRGEELKAGEIRRAGVRYGLDFTNTAFNGDTSANVKQPNGWKKLIDNYIAQGKMPAEQLIDNQNGPLTLAAMQLAKSHVWPDTNGAFFMNLDVFNYYQSLIRDSGQAGYFRIEEDRTMFGTPISTFGGWPVRVVMQTNNYSTPLAFNENGNSTCSFYCVTFDSEMGAFCAANGGIGLTAQPFVDLKIDGFIRSYTDWEYAFDFGGPRSAVRTFNVTAS